MLLELPERSWTLRAAGSRNSAIRDKSRENRLGWDLQSPGRGERDKICIGFNRAKTLCKLGVQKTGLAIAGVGQEWGSPVARACSGLASTAGRG